MFASTMDRVFADENLHEPRITAKKTLPVGNTATENPVLTPVFTAPPNRVPGLPVLNLHGVPITGGTAVTNGSGAVPARTAEQTGLLRDMDMNVSWSPGVRSSKRVKSTVVQARVVPVAHARNAPAKATATVDLTEPPTAGLDYGPRGHAERVEYYGREDREDHEDRECEWKDRYNRSDRHDRRESERNRQRGSERGHDRHERRRSPAECFPPADRAYSGSSSDSDKGEDVNSVAALAKRMAMLEESNRTLKEENLKAKLKSFKESSLGNVKWGKDHNALAYQLLSDLINAFEFIRGGLKELVAKLPEEIDCTDLTEVAAVGYHLAKLQYAVLLVSDKKDCGLKHGVAYYNAMTDKIRRPRRVKDRERADFATINTSELARVMTNNPVEKAATNNSNRGGGNNNRGRGQGYGRGNGQGYGRGGGGAWYNPNQRNEPNHKQ